MPTRRSQLAAMEAFVERLEGRSVSVHRVRYRPERTIEDELGLRAEDGVRELHLCEVVDYELRPSAASRYVGTEHRCFSLRPSGWSSTAAPTGGRPLELRHRESPPVAGANACSARAGGCAQPVRVRGDRESAERFSGPSRQTDRRCFTRCYPGAQHRTDHSRESPPAPLGAGAARRILPVGASVECRRLCPPGDRMAGVHSWRVSVSRGNAANQQLFEHTNAMPEAFHSAATGHAPERTRNVVQSSENSLRIFSIAGKASRKASRTSGSKCFPRSSRMMLSACSRSKARL